MVKTTKAVLSCIIFLWFSFMPATIWAQISGQPLLRACKVQISAKFRDWRVAPVTNDVAQFSRAHNVNPTTIWGDFDGDGTKDVAILFVDDTEQSTPGQDFRHIGVCMNTTSGARLYVIEKPYCGDGIAVAAKGRRYYDFEKKTYRTYHHDGVHAYCFEKAGATYQFENGSFHRIVDSD